MSLLRLLSMMDLYYTTLRAAVFGGGICCCFIVLIFFVGILVLFVQFFLILLGGDGRKVVFAMLWTFKINQSNCGQIASILDAWNIQHTSSTWYHLFNSF